MDVTLSTVGLVLSAPIQAVTAIALLALQGRPVLFQQERPGKNAKLFKMVKFRTMHPQGADLRTDAERLTRFGKFLRSTSLDELPTLWNVLKGDMSLVGPRPLLVEYLPRYTPRQARRHEVRPGVTGLAQIAGRNTLSWPEKLELDTAYVDNRSLKLDMRILAGTVRSVLIREGINQPGHVTMPEFRGDD